MLDLAKLFNDALPEKEKNSLPDPDYVTPPRVKNIPSPRVKESIKFNEPTMSAQPTSPDIIQNTPQTVSGGGGGGGGDHSDHSDDTRVTDNTDPKQRASSLMSCVLEEDNVKTPQPLQRSRFHFCRARSPVPMDDDNDDRKGR